MASGTLTVDAFLGGQLRLAQPEAGHRAGLDAVMLAAAAPVVAGQRVLDAGSGMGVVGLCIARRVPGCHVTGIEVDPSLAALAGENAKINELSDRYRALSGDLTGPLSHIETLGPKRDSFHVVVSNPPFYGAGRGSVSLEPAKHRAGVMPEGGLEDWIRFMTTMTSPGGTLVLIHQAAALGEILALLDGRCGAAKVYPLFPRAGEPAHRILVSARKGSRAGLTLRQGMVLHGDGNQFTDEAEAVLRHGAAITLSK